MRWILPIAMALALVACDEHDHDHGDVNTELCEHMGSGPSIAVTAVADNTAPLPSVSEEHTRYDVTLVDFEGMKGGWVQFESTKATDYVIALNTTDAIEILDSSDQAIAIEMSGSNDDCTDVALQHTVDLPVGTVRIKVGPTSAETVQIVIEEAGGHEGE